MKLNLTGRYGVGDFNAFQANLRRMAWRASHLCGTTLDGKPLGAHIHELLMETHKANTDPEALKERADYLGRASGDPKLQMELNALRIETVSNYAFASANMASLWFETVSLKKDERPVFQNETVQQTRIHTTSTDAGHKSLIKAVPSQTEVLIDLIWLITQPVRYRKVDIYNGDIMESQQRILRLASDWTQEIEERCFNLATTAPSNSGQGGGLFGLFNYNPSAANKELEVLVPQRRIITANLPQTNSLVAPGAGSATKFSFACIRQAIDYEVRFGGAIEGGSPQLTGRIFIPGIDLTGIAEEIIPSGNTNNKVADDLMEKGWSSVTYLGRTFTLVQDNTLEAGVCYYEFVRKPGRIYIKPELAVEEKLPPTEEMRVNNEEASYSKQPFGAYINFTQRVHALRQRFKGTTAQINAFKA